MAYVVERPSITRRLNLAKTTCQEKHLLNVSGAVGMAVSWLQHFIIIIQNQMRWIDETKGGIWNCNKTDYKYTKIKCELWDREKNILQDCEKANSKFQSHMICHYWLI